MWDPFSSLSLCCHFYACLLEWYLLNHPTWNISTISNYQTDMPVNQTSNQDLSEIFLSINSNHRNVIFFASFQPSGNSLKKKHYQFSQCNQTEFLADASEWEKIYLSYIWRCGNGILLDEVCFAIRSQRVVSHRRKIQVQKERDLLLVKCRHLTWDLSKVKATVTWNTSENHHTSRALE